MKVSNKKINTRIWTRLLLFILIVILPISLGIMTRLSFKRDNPIETKNGLDSIRVYNVTSTSQYYDKVIDIDDMINKCTVIAKVKMTDSKEYLNQCILSKVKLIKTYKGNIDNNTEEYIYIYEPIDLKKSQESMYAHMGYLPMIKDDEYIVFLKPLKVPEGYKMSEKEKISFMYYNPTFGKLDIKKLLPYILNDDKNNNVSYKDVKNNNVIIDKSKVKLYNDFNRIASSYN